MTRLRIAPAIVGASLAMSGLVAGCGSDNVPGPDLIAEVDVTPAETVRLTRAGFEPDSVCIEQGALIEILNRAADTTLTSTEHTHQVGTFPGGQSVTLGFREIGEFTFVAAAEADAAERPDQDPAHLVVRVDPAGPESC